MRDCVQFSLTRVQRAVSLNSEEGWVYEERALSDEIVISVSAPCQLMGIGLCGTVGAFTVDAEVSQVRHLDNSEFFSSALPITLRNNVATTLRQPFQRLRLHQTVVHH